MSAETQQAETDKPRGLREGMPKILPKRINPVLIFILIFTLIVAWQWYDTRDQIAGLQLELA